MEVEEAEDNIFKEPAMLQRLIDLNKLSDKDKEHALFNLDGILTTSQTNFATNGNKIFVGYQYRYLLLNL